MQLNCCTGPCRLEVTFIFKECIFHKHNDFYLKAPK